MMLRLPSRTPYQISATFKRLGLSSKFVIPGVYNGSISLGQPQKQEILQSKCPTTDRILAEVASGSPRDVHNIIHHMSPHVKDWMTVPAPKRGEVVRQIRDKIAQHKSDLALIISLEMGKIYTEALGEVQEFIDICDYAVGLSRQVGGQVFPSERSGHFFFENWNPLGIVGVISAYNFPMAVYGWNMALSLICGNGVLWKGAPTTNLCSISIIKLVQEVLDKNGYSPSICSLVTGGKEVGAALVSHPRIPLVSFTGSTDVGRLVGMKVQERFGKSLLELGGNNAVIIMEDADLDLAVSSILFAAIGTTGQRCTTTRRLFIHADVYDQFKEKLIAAYEKVIIGDPLAPNVMCGPLHTKDLVKKFTATIRQIDKQGGSVLYGGNTYTWNNHSSGNFVQPTLVECMKPSKVMNAENFVPILFLQKIKSFDEAIQKNNSTLWGLSSSVFTRDVSRLFKWLGPMGSDCGIVNVNIPTNGAEIGGAFGGEKATGGGRESGSDSWKQYMRRSTCTVNFDGSLQLAQGVKF